MSRRRAVVLGAGSAGEGHTLAMRHAGAEVVAMVARTGDSARRTAGALGIPRAETDWHACIDALRPDIVCVATPADLHAEMIATAAALGCDLFVDKPVAPTAAAARRAWEDVRAAGVKSAYAATARYMPGALQAAELVRHGTIGRLLEAEFVSHYHWSPLMPFGWPHRLARGGGRLNNNFSHKIAIAEAVCAGVALAVAGETRNDLQRAPVAPFPPDFRLATANPVPAEAAAQGEWAEVDSDWSYTALVHIGAPAAPADAVGVTFRHSCLRRGLLPDYAAFYGSEGTLHVEGAYCQGPVHLWREGEEGFSPLPPPDLSAHGVAGDVPAHWPPGWAAAQRCWNALAQDFVADLQGQPAAPYLTLLDGWRHQELIDAIRAGAGWHRLPEPCLRVRATA